MNDLRKAAERVLKTWDRWKGGPFEYEMEALRQALAQPEQEPVACVCRGVYSFTGHCPECQPLYTAPPKREWVGLTDEEIYDYADKFLYQHGSNYGILSFGKAIETKLKENT